MINKYNINASNFQIECWLNSIPVTKASRQKKETFVTPTSAAQQFEELELY